MNEKSDRSLRRAQTRAGFQEALLRTPIKYVKAEKRQARFPLAATVFRGYQREGCITIHASYTKLRLFMFFSPVHEYSISAIGCFSVLEHRALRIPRNSVRVSKQTWLCIAYKILGSIVSYLVPSPFCLFPKKFFRCEKLQ